jgi:predicted DNA-binding WGR domain protein
MAKVSNGCIIDEGCQYKDGEIIGTKDNVYSCMLNHTDIKSNANKFYIMQIVKNGSEYVHYVRYGRIGDTGIKSHKKFISEDQAKYFFESQFRSKTGNTWKKTFVKKNGKYFLTEVNYDDVKDVDKYDKHVDVKSTLDQKVQDLIALFTDVKMMKNTLVELDIDTKKLPLGKLKLSQIEKAIDLVKDIQKNVSKIEDYKKLKVTSEIDELKEKIVDLSSEYYTYIPISCGRRKPPIIDNDDIISKYSNTLDDLKNLVVAVKILEHKSDTNVHPVDNIYKGLNTSIKYVGPTTAIYKEIDKYIKNSHGATHYFKLELLDVYEIERNDNVKQFEKYCKDNKIENRELLIHGSRLGNWVSILKFNLLLDPAKLGVKIHGKMFGNSIYMANSFSKSAQYCSGTTGSTICFTLAEVALGKPSERVASDYYITKDSLKKEGCDSTWGRGRMTPSSYTEINGFKIPNGELVPSNINTVLQYDEKMIYDSNQFCMRYIVLAKFN